MAALRVAGPCEVVKSPNGVESQAHIEAFEDKRTWNEPAEWEFLDHSPALTRWAIFRGGVLEALAIFRSTVDSRPVARCKTLPRISISEFADSYLPAMLQIGSRSYHFVRSQSGLLPGKGLAGTGTRVVLRG
jgi:hypothetical protein